MYCVIYIIKQHIHIYVPSDRLNGWTEWTDFFRELMGGPGVSTYAKKVEIFFYKLKKNSSDSK